MAQTCVMIFRTLQNNDRPENRLLALACAFILMAKAARVEAQDVFTAAGNLMVDETTSEQMVPQFAAMKFHLEEDMVRR